MCYSAQRTMSKPLSNGQLQLVTASNADCEPSFSPTAAEVQSAKRNSPSDLGRICMKFTFSFSVFIFALSIGDLNI